MSVVHRRRLRREARLAPGASLVELIVFIVIVGIATAGVLAALNVSTRASADPLPQKQALAIAEALLEEVQLRPFTYCDPDDANAARATTARLDASVTPPQVGCAATIEVMGPEGETRAGVTPFDNVNDYAGGFSLAGISDLTGAAIADLAGYNATVTVVPQALAGIAGTDANGAPLSLLITVTVTGPAGSTARLDGYRVRYAPNAL
ncbi:MAG: type II secretion system protein [Burkholderiales bacterium]|nr:type II secretion system protein [Burkholderiales bacterium]